MDAINAENTTHPVEVSTGEWLLPSAALDRFELPADMVLAPTVEKEILRYGYRMGSLGMLIKLGSTSEVMHPPAISTLPGSPHWLLGLINLRGNLIPIFDLRKVLGVEPQPSAEQALILVLDQADKAVGITIDGFPKPLSALNTLPAIPQLPSMLIGHVSKAYVKEELIWLEFDHATFFEALARISENLANNVSL